MVERPGCVTVPNIYHLPKNYVVGAFHKPNDIRETKDSMTVCNCFTDIEQMHLWNPERRANELCRLPIPDAQTGVDIRKRHVFELLQFLVVNTTRAQQ